MTMLGSSRRSDALRHHGPVPAEHGLAAESLLQIRARHAGSEAGLNG